MQIKRDIIERFKAWKDSPDRKPILLKGARQIGKTWAAEEFGKECFPHSVTFDFVRRPELASAFRSNKDPERIIKELSLYTEVPLIPGKTLIIFDEIQECEDAFNALKYFCEDAPEYHIIAAGSLLGVAVKKKRMSVPVGKVNVMRMFPLTFREFLRMADERTFQYIEDMDAPEHLPVVIMNKLSLEFRRYQVCGGMPEAASAMLDVKGTGAVEDALQGILDLYELDFSKYAAPIEIPRIRALWQSLPSQLAKENRKFIYKVVRSGARARDYEDSLLWLEDAGMIYRIFNVSKPGIPLSGYKEVDAFKAYACDCGLLRRLAHLPAEVVMLSESIGYTEFKGAMAESVILQSLMATLGDDTPYYWTSGNDAEVEFVVGRGDEIIPIEVKAENAISGKSLSVYDKKYAPAHRVRFSMRNLQFNGNLLSCPLPLADWYEKFLK